MKRKRGGTSLKLIFQDENHLLEKQIIKELNKRTQANICHSVDDLTTLLQKTVKNHQQRFINNDKTSLSVTKLRNDSMLNLY